MKSALRKLLWMSIASLALILTACTDDDSDSEGGDDSFDRTALLANMADKVIVPAYQNFGAAIETLDQNATGFAQNPNQANLDQLRTSLIAATEAWQEAALYDFGPAFDNGLLGFVNLYPIDTAKVNTLIAAGAYNLESPQNSDATGLQAIDYFLWGSRESDEAIFTYFSSNENARNYLTDITSILDQRTSAALVAWEGDYRNTFVGATGTDIGSSMGQLINASIRYFERNLRDGKIGIPAGARTSSGEALPDHVEGLYSKEYSKIYLIQSIQTWQDMFNGVSRQGTDGEGLSDYLNFLGTEFEAGMPLQEEINRRFDLVKESIEPLDQNLATAVQTQQIQSLEVFDEMQRIVVLLKVDMTSAMGIQITYADNDGD